MKSFDELIGIVKSLRGPGGCPWDKAQSFESLTPFAIEEAHELEEAIVLKDWDNLKEELGDLLFQSVLHAQIASETQLFDIDDVISNLNEKMIYRHPHVFAQTQCANKEEVMENWETLKAKEKPKDPLDIPKSFPALLRAHKIGKRTKGHKFDWHTPAQVMEKVDEELLELKEAMANQDKRHTEEELGDLLFTLSQLARHLDMDAEKALRLANNKFLGRFKKMLEHEPDLAGLTDEQKKSLWEKVKADQT